MKEEILANATYTTEEAARLLNLNPITVQGMIRKGTIAPVARAGKKYIIPGAALLAFLGIKGE